MKKLLCILIITCEAGAAFGQQEPRNYTYLEVGGNGILGSLNYERQLTTEPLFGVRGGVGYYQQNGRSYVTVPIGTNLLLRLKRHRNSFVDLGFGVTLSPHNDFLFGDSGTGASPYTVVYIPSIAFRHHTRNEWMWRASLTPLKDKYSSSNPWFGFSIGRRF